MKIIIQMFKKKYYKLTQTLNKFNFRHRTKEVIYIYNLLAQDVVSKMNLTDEIQNS